MHKVDFKHMPEMLQTVRTPGARPVRTDDAARPGQARAFGFVQRRDAVFIRQAIAGLSLILAGGLAHAELADQPISAASLQPANVLLSLSVEWPTGNVQAYNDQTEGTGCIGRVNARSVCYFEPAERASRVNAANVSNPAYSAVGSMPYLGYFDPYKCYSYRDNTGTDFDYFEPVGMTSGYDLTRRYDQQPTTSTAQCPSASQWSGNFLNWATMQTIDIFRWTMTGGDRRHDTASFTVLEKARHDGQGGTNQFPIKHVGPVFSNALGTVPQVTPSNVAAVPLGTAQLFIRVDGQNTAMLVSTAADMSGAQTLFVRPQVCVPSFPESVTSCKAYGAAPSISYKPVGLIQDNADVARFGAFGYLLDAAGLRDGGVMRARIKFVGPTKPALGTQSTVSNGVAEWSESTGIFTPNPDPADATATAGAVVSRSGVINYLNKFGRENGYKTLDPFSELFYESLRYFKNLGPTPEYSTLTGDAAAQARQVDGFPVIKNWDDPLARPDGFTSANEWCPKNFIIGIADANTHRDKRLPGNTAVDGEGGAQPSNPDNSFNVTTLLNEIIANELSNEGVQLLRPNGSPLTVGSVSANMGSAYLAALAYHAHTTDIRPDTTAVHTHGKQTIRSFVIDVREAGGWGMGVIRTDPRRRNQLWLAAKYGGFEDRNNDGKLTADDAIADLNGDGVIDVRDVWDQNGDWLPDTHFEAASAEALVNGLRSAFASIRQEIATNAAVGVSGAKSQLQTNTGLYQSNFDPSNWSGDVEAFQFRSIDAVTGDVTIAPVWSAGAKIAAQNWNSGRRIVTMTRDSKLLTDNGNTRSAVNFRWNNISQWQKDMLGTSDVLDWLRGRRDDARFRLRLRGSGQGQGYEPSSLGDIVDSSPRFVGAPASRLSELYNPGYGAFKLARQNRLPMLYVGANDGMVHAIDARVDHANGGREVWAYVPSHLYAGVTAPETDGLRALSDRNYIHRYYVNATATVADVDFARTSTSSGGGDWRTVLIGGLGKGGRGFYALDVTNGGAVNSEVDARSRVLWEFEDQTMGFSFGKPQIAKTARWGWVVLFTSGYDNISSYGSTGLGRSYLYVVDVKTGALLQRISFGGGTDTSPNGFSEVTAYAPNGADGTVTEVYGGDLKGRLWRFDFKSATANVPAPILLARMRSATNVLQPITTGPIIRIAPVSRMRYVFVGTGRLLENADLFDNSEQSFYALIDGTRNEAYPDGSSQIGTGYTRARLEKQGDLTKPLLMAADKFGWYYDMPGTGERVIVDPQDTDVGKISWLGSMPNSVGLCTGDGSSRVYVADFETGQSQLFKDTASGPERVAAVDPGTSGVGLQLVRVGNNIRALVTGNKKTLKVTQGYLQYQRPRTLNWREITEPAD